MIFSGAPPIDAPFDVDVDVDPEQDVQTTAAKVASVAARIPLFVKRTFGSNQLHDDRPWARHHWVDVEGQHRCLSTEVWNFMVVERFLGHGRGQVEGAKEARVPPPRRRG